MEAAEGGGEAMASLFTSGITNPFIFVNVFFRRCSIGSSEVSKPLELCDLICGEGVVCPLSLLRVLFGNADPISIRL